MQGTADTVVSKVTTDSYDIVYGNWPEKYNEVILVLDENNSISTSVLYQLGFITKDEYESIEEQISNNQQTDIISWSYEELYGHTFNLIPYCDYYIHNQDGTFTNVKDDTSYEQQFLNNSIELTVVGVVRPVTDAVNANISTAVAYTSMLTDYVIEYTNKSEIVKAQEGTPDLNVINGLRFEAADDKSKIEQANSYISHLNMSDKASMYSMIQYAQTSQTNGNNKDNTEKQGQQSIQNQHDIQVPDNTDKMNSSTTMDETSLAAAMDLWLTETPDDNILLSIYENYVEGSTYEDNLSLFGKVSYDAPYSISIYTDSFDDKESVSECIAEYNKTVDEDKQITYTDYVAILTSSLTSIVNIISYVLIAFVSVSLVVSCIMIGIITHISVLERTKEIGILRAIGASKRNISQVFNAETFIIGICSGILGVVISILLTIPINKIIDMLLDSDTMQATLPLNYAAILIFISVIITVIGGLLPSKKAAKKDPVIALRSE